MGVRKESGGIIGVSEGSWEELGVSGVSFRRSQSGVSRREQGVKECCGCSHSGVGKSQRAVSKNWRGVKGRSEGVKEASEGVTGVTRREGVVRSQRVKGRSGTSSWAE